MSISPSPAAQPTARPVRVWDFPTRAFHWSLAALVGFSWYSGDRAGPWLEWHFWSGYAVLALLLFRVAWGFVGGAWARFSSFLRGPGAAIHHIRDLFSPRDMRDIGHNPIGGWMVLAMLLILFAQVAMGLFISDSDMGLTSGPYADYVSDALRSRLLSLHGLNGKLILLLIAAHVSAVVIYLIWKGENLIGAMITGRKTLDPELRAEAERVKADGGVWLALAILAASIGAVTAIVRLA
ncbi:MAG: cytochrome b/b6 domain-containing protein [Elsteraceae bacterium]